VLILIFLFSIPVLSSAQFEQKISINLSPGFFKTFGKKLGKFDPYQMPNYKAGYNLGAGLQFNLNRRFSLMADLMYMHSSSWSYKGSGSTDFMYFTIFDTLSVDNLLGDGYNELNLSNYCISLRPKFYFLPGRKWNPYIFAGVSMNYTEAKFTDNYYKVAKRLNYLPADYSVGYDPYLENNVGIGINSGLGLEYCPNENISFFLSAGHYFIVMNKEKFKSPTLEENFNAFIGQAGVRFSFIKSKKL
jgi:opacity protein-like surface antigen